MADSRSRDSLRYFFTAALEKATLSRLQQATGSLTTSLRDSKRLVLTKLDPFSLQPSDYPTSPYYHPPPSLSGFSQYPLVKSTVSGTGNCWDRLPHSVPRELLIPNVPEDVVHVH